MLYGQAFFHRACGFPADILMAEEWVLQHVNRIKKKPTEWIQYNYNL
jgi:hypothetical protein